MTAARPDHNSPWVLDIRPLGRRPGSLKAMTIDLPVDDPIGNEVLAVPAGHEVELDIRLESVTEGVLVSGTAYAEATGECARCLTPVSEPVESNLRELFAYPGSATDETTETDELPRVVDDLIDLLPLVRDELTLALPLVPLCSPDCAGLCPECGERFAELEPGHSHEILDPRWAALAEKFGSTSSADAASSPESAGNSQQETPKEK
ncbi:YceD family protein [Nakamurella lactea]|uniref:YceD family protein n=1 Tax=Nakamurella lactea TaxID=459515 RepID=UPI00048AAC0B